MSNLTYRLIGLSIGLQVLLPIAVAPAQTIDPIISSYRDYTAAKARGDLSAADAAAVRALSASEARDGGGGVTAILAMNLAIVRMGEGRPTEAIAPARRALELVKAGAKGVDPLAVRLMLGEAELSVNPRGDSRNLEGAILEADGHDLSIDDYAYPAAVVLGDAAMIAKHWDVMRVAWRSAQRHIGGAGESRESRGFLLAQAMTREALALVFLRQDIDADVLLTKAIGILAPLAPETKEITTISAAEAKYADAIVIRSAERARSVLEGGYPPSENDVERPDIPGLPKLCDGNFSPNILPNFPSRALHHTSVGAVVVRAKINAKGEVITTNIIASFPDTEFGKSVENPNIKWKFDLKKSQPLGCRVESNDRLFGVKFTFPTY